jgi:hypothetical protein
MSGHKDRQFRAGLKCSPSEESVVREHRTNDQDDGGCELGHAVQQVLVSRKHTQYSRQAPAFRMFTTKRTAAHTVNAATISPCRLVRKSRIGLNGSIDTQGIARGQ